VTPEVFATLKLGAPVMLAREEKLHGLKYARLGHVRAIQFQRQRLEIEWPDGSRRWYARRELV
jgi:hypothetical protein